MINLKNEIISPHVIEPDILVGFKSFCKQVFEVESDIADVKIYKLISSQDNELAELSDIPIYEFYSCSTNSPEQLYNDVCNSFRIFNNELLRIINDNKGIIYNRYIKCYSTDYESDGYSYVHYLADQWQWVNEQVFLFFEKHAFGENIYKKLDVSRKEKGLPRKTKNNFYTAFQSPIPFVWDHNSHLFIPDKNSLLIDSVRVEHEYLRMRLRLASICQAFSYYYKYQASIKNPTNNKLRAKVYLERTQKWLFAADVHLSHVNNYLSQYKKKRNKQQHSEKQQKDIGKETRKAIQEKLNTLEKQYYKTKEFKHLTKKEIYKHIRRHKSHCIKISKSNYNSSADYLKVETIKTHITEIIKELGIP